MTTTDSPIQSIEKVIRAIDGRSACLRLAKERLDGELRGLIWAKQLHEEKRNDQ